MSPNGLQVSEHPAAARVSEQPVCLRTACVCLRTIYVRLRCSFHHFVYVFDRYNAVTRALTAGLTRSGTPWDAVVMPRGQEAAWRRPKSAVIGSCPVNSGVMSCMASPQVPTHGLGLGWSKAVARADTAVLTRSGTPWDAVVMPQGQEAAWRRLKSAVISSCPFNGLSVNGSWRRRKCPEQMSRQAADTSARAPYSWGCSAFTLYPL